MDESTQPLKAQSDRVLPDSSEKALKAKAYQKHKQALTLASLVLTPAILLLLAITPLSVFFKDSSFSMASNSFVALALYFLFFSLATLILDFPFSFYSGFILEHRFDLSNQTFPAWLSEFMKKAVLSFVLSLLLIEALYGLIWAYPEKWWVLAWAGYAGVSYVLGKLFPVLIVPLFYKYSPLPDHSLKSRILAMCQHYGLPVENVYSLNLSKTTKKANAAFMGMGKTKRVVLSDTLLENFTEDEIETVVAHELGHFKHHDIWKQFGLGLVLSWVGFWIVHKVMDPMSSWFGLGGASDPAAMPLLFLIFYVFHLILMPLQNGFSRWVERAADRFALKAFPKRDVFISCMHKLGSLNLADPEPHPVYEWFFYDHPSIGKRIRMAKEGMSDEGKKISCLLFFIFQFLILCLSSLITHHSSLAAEEKSHAVESVEKRQKIELKGFFLKDPEDAQLPQTPIAIGLYNQAVQHFQNHDYELAKQALQDSIAYDDKNALAYDLLGELEYREQNLSEARENWEIAYALEPNEMLKEKLSKLKDETKVETKLSTYREQHFIIKYHNEDRRFEGFELRELLRNTYTNISHDFAYYFDHKVVVLLYDEEEFRQISNAPHWAGGLYDGKVRMPVSKKGFKEDDLKALTMHEVTHAFVAAMSSNVAPAWINEGLAEYEESKVQKPTLSIFKSAMRSNTLFSADELMGQASSAAISNPAKVSLFYEQSYSLVSYMVERYGMFRIKQLLAEFGKGKDSDEALRGVLHISPERLEKEWLATLSK